MISKILGRTKKPKFHKEPIWKVVNNAESKNSTWEIFRAENKNGIRLHYVPEENYSENDININLTYEEFEDLIKFAKSLDSKYY